MFQIGEFSKLSRVSRRLLHHYEELGLFKPANVDPQTGYRYYSASQIPELNKILALKDLGFSLNQIIPVIQENISEEELRGMLRLREAEVERTLLEEHQRLHRIKARLQLTEITGNRPEVVLKAIPEQHFLSARCIIRDAEQMVQIFTQIMEAAHAAIPPGILGPFMAIIHTGEFRTDNNDVELGFQTQKAVQKQVQVSEICTLTDVSLPPVSTMATAVQVGNPEHLFVALGNIATWIEQNRYKIAGPYRELILQNPDASDLSNGIFEIQMPVKPAQPLNHE